MASSAPPVNGSDPPCSSLTQRAWAGDAAAALGESVRRAGAQVQMAALQAQQLAWQQGNLAARLAGLKAAAAQSELNQALKARTLRTWPS